MELFNIYAPKKIRIALLAFKSENLKEYKAILDKFDAKVIEIEREEDCKIFFESIKWNGILIDIPTYIKCSQKTKDLISDFNKIYPTARIRYDSSKSCMDLTILEEGKKIELNEFLEDRCAHFNARHLRKYKRAMINMNCKVLAELNGNPLEIFCTTANISENGLFIMNRSDYLAIGKSVKIEIKELGNPDKVIYGTIVRSLNWGDYPFHAPGYGIRIDNIDSEIVQEYLKLARKEW
ncbi:hypothetical protein AGMMS49938_18110 [Fibrobacterales bacterium]|nr:hypothetical protein AGMMS49938_18110 [Fibrobacterales bacterium]